MTLSNCDYVHPPPPSQTTHPHSEEDTNLGDSEKAVEEMANPEEQLSSTSCSDSVDDNDMKEVDNPFQINHRVSQARNFNFHEHTAEKLGQKKAFNYFKNAFLKSDL